MSRWWRRALSGASGAALLAGQGVAQAPPTREEIQRPELELDAQLRAGEPALEGDIERAPCPLAQPRYADIRFTLNDVEFANLPPVPPDSLRSTFAQYIGREVPISVVCDIRDRAATILRDHGYLAAVQVPPQQIGADGIVRFDVLTARIARLQVRGETGNSEQVVARYLEPLTEAEVFNQREAERSLLLARQLPGYDTRLTLRPAEGAPGEVIGDVRIERTRLLLEGNVQNYAAPSSGRWGGLVRAHLFDVTGLGDRTTLGAFASADFDEQLVLTAAHDFAVGGDGLRLGGEFTYAWNDPTIAGASPFDTETLIGSLRAGYPFVLDQATRISGSAGFELIDQQIRFGGAALNEDRLRVAFARIEGSFLDRPSIEGAGGYSPAEPRWRAGFAVEFRQGLDIFGATEPGLPPAIPVPQTRSAGRADATVIRAEGLLELRPDPLVAFVLQPRAQLSFDPLLAYEEFAGGNYTIGRGYDPGAVLGDQGVGFRSELRYGSVIPRSRARFAIQPFVFFDAAWVWNDDPPVLGFAGSDELYSAGGGVRAAYGDRALLDIAFAVPLAATGMQASAPDPRLLLSLTVRFAR